MNEAYKPFTGIGSRDSPANILSDMMAIARSLCEAGWTLRSGGASGADEAFRQGAIQTRGAQEIFLPWQGFNNLFNELNFPFEAAARIARQYHPVFDRLSQGAQKLHARNVQQILGENLDSPTKLVICWTPKGAVTGGTATAIKIAKANSIPVINLAVESFDSKEWIDGETRKEKTVV